MVNNRIGEWVGPYKVITADYSSKLVYIREIEDGFPRPYNFAQVKRYVSATDVSRAFLLDVQEGLKKPCKRIPPCTPDGSSDNK